MKRIIPVLAGLMILKSCGGLRTPESIDEKMRRYQAQDEKLATKADLPILDYRFKNRAIASQPKKKSASFEGYSNKRVYFLTLLSQYNQLRLLSEGHAPKIEHCPSFHTAMVNNRFHLEPSKAKKKDLGQLVGKFSVDQLKNKQFLAKKPLFSLPMTNMMAHPNLAEILIKSSPSEHKSLVNKAFDGHLHRNHQELKKLCEKGVSDNYYVFENLVTYFSGGIEGVRQKKGVQTLMKMTLFINMALQTSFGIRPQKMKKGRTIASSQYVDSKFSVFENEVFDRLNVDWSKEYFQVFEQ